MKRRADWGSVTQVSRGVWRIRYWADGEDGYKRRSKTVRGSRRDAGDVLAALRLEHSQDAPQPTVSQCWSRWYLPDMERRVAAGEMAVQSVEQYCSLWHKHIEPAWGDVPVDQVRPLAVQQWISSLPHSAARSCLPIMRRTIAYAVRYEHIPANPMDVDYVMPSRNTSAIRDDGTWSPDGLMKVWEACHDTPLEAVVLLCGFGSCRVGEALGVKSDDVWRMEVDGITVACVRIDSQIDGHGRVTESTKNRWSTRTVVLAGKPAERLLEIAANESGWVVSDGTGRPMKQKVMREAFTARLEAMGVECHPPKNLRKTWQTIARWALKMPPWITERMMGHVGDGVTGRHYDRPEAEEFAAALASAWRDNSFADDAPFLRPNCVPNDE